MYDGYHTLSSLQGAWHGSHRLGDSSTDCDAVRGRLEHIGDLETHADDALLDPALVNLDTSFLGLPWPSGANNKVALAVQWAEEAPNVSTDQEKADRLASVSKIINHIKNDIGA